METAKNMEQTNRFAGLVPIIVIFCVLNLSPLLYFLINLMLGNEHLFNGIIMN